MSVKRSLSVFVGAMTIAAATAGVVTPAQAAPRGAGCTAGEGPFAMWLPEGRSTNINGVVHICVNGSWVKETSSGCEYGHEPFRREMPQASTYNGNGTIYKCVNGVWSPQ